MLPWTNEKKPPKNQLEQPDFANWLDNKVTTPTKQSTGDEYYWQHQAQLQQSDLHFDAKQLETQQPQYILNSNGACSFNSEIAHEKKEPIQSYNNFSPPIQKVEPDNSYPAKVTSLLAEVEQLVEHPLLSEIQTHQKTTSESTADSKIEKNNEIPLNPLPHFKNNHLFLDGKQAELTVNLNHFTKEEQKELIHIIQDYFKKKGLVLSRLIINGVKND